MTVKATKFKAGRSYKVGQNGAGDVSLKYQVILEEPLGENELPTSFAGVPAIGSVHPSRPGLYALSYDVSPPDGAAKPSLPSCTFAWHLVPPPAATVQETWSRTIADWSAPSSSM